MQSTLTGTVASHDCTMDSLDDLDRLLSNSADFTEFVTAPDLPSVYSQPKDVQNENTAGRRGTLRPDDTPDPTLQGRKQRALDKSREAQKRFRQRQKARLDTIQLQLDETTKQLRDLNVQQQHLQTRNILLEKIAQLSKEQTTDDYLAWQHKQAALDFTCGHTEATPQGFTLTLTIFGHAESKECRSVSNMSLSELAALWTEYMRKLGKCLLSIQQDERAGARPLLNLWVAEAIALICCVRVYNPEFLKAIDSAAMNGSAAVRPSHLLLIQHLELLEFTDAQIQDVLYLRRIVAARAHDLEKQRHEATARMLSQASMKQHPSDHLAESKASSQELKLIGMEEYKLHGIATDALANGICSSIQNAMALVHMYPFLPDALEYLELVAEQQGDQTLRHMKPNLMQHPGPDQTPLYMTDGVNQAQISGHVTAVLDHQMPHYMMSGLDREQSVTQAPSTSVTGASGVLRLRIGHVTAFCASDIAGLPLGACKQACSASLPTQRDRLPRVFGPAPARSVACRSAEQQLELSEESVEEALQDAKQELMQLFDENVGITGTVTLAELDGPFVKLRLQGRFWHKRADVLARVAAYLQRRIPDLMEVEIEDDTQLDDSAAHF
ncbi:hypothetical protein WJX79_007575 [Trebouxia sp. C0005]